MIYFNHFKKFLTRKEIKTSLQIANYLQIIKTKLVNAILVTFHATVSALEKPVS